MKRMDGRRRAWRWGNLAEGLAAWMLRLSGYRILARRFRSPVGEIDIVARRGNLLIAVEVKARRDEREAAEAVTPRQRMRISRALEAFIARYPRYAVLDIRFDVILVRPLVWSSARSSIRSSIRSWGLPRHIRDAWRPGD